MANRRLLPSGVRVDEADVHARVRAKVEWNLATLVGVYERSAHRNPRWDAAATKGLTLAARHWADDPTRAADTADQAWASLREAISQGCNDPVVIYVAARFEASDLPRLEAANRTIAAALRLQDATYPAYRRGYALIMGAESLLEASYGTTQSEWDPRWRTIVDLLNRSIAILPDVARDRTVPVEALLTYVNDIQHAWVGGRQDRQKAFKEIEEAVSASRDASDPVLPLMRAWFYAHYAWDARGTAVAANVKEENWPVFKTRLAQAEDETARAVELGSANPAVPAVMTRVAKGLYGERDELEKWFELWRQVDPGAYAPYSAKLDWIHPKWHGSARETLAFAREVRRTGAWNIRAPMLVVDAHRALKDGPPKRPDHFKEPGVCNDVLDVYQDLLKQYPDSVSDRGAYAWWLTECERWPEAEQQFQMLTGNRLRVGAFGGQAEYESRRKRAAAHSGAALTGDGAR